MTLINMGAEAVDMDGNPIHQKAEYELFGIESSVMAESTPSYNTLDERIVELLNNGEYTAKQIIEILHLSDYNSQKLSQRLSKLDGIQINKKGKTNKYSLQPQKQPEQLSLSL